MNTITDWKLHGSYFEACNCETACPCIWLQPPSEGNCKLLVAWHIDSGYLNGESLDDLNVALACFSPGHMKDGNWQAALYVDERASDGQFNAVTEIYSGRHGGHPAVLMSFVTEIWGIRKVKIDYCARGNQRELSIPGIAEMAVESIQGIQDGEATIENPPLCVVASHPAVVARSSNYAYHDFNKSWKFSNRNSYFSQFTYQP
ncbi:DUF1326 domain-containing protein [Nitrosomonas marina]|uniref:DUF1326 domain-containing protein n=1 Tax=Nitrosomonas marina TaxID=917 RepID=A0A1H8DKE1_9PROT|nr:DUF1326 domain-containing protein [Nitrosomonas marina]SEN07626.1 hypothetical protein SAMN05216325_10756 [Nitrosomonas marina]